MDSASRVLKKTNCVSENRVGSFLVSRHLIENFPEEVMALFSKMVIVNSEQEYSSKSIRYFAYSPLFSIWSPESVTPEYEIVVDVIYNQDGERKVSFQAKKIGTEEKKVRVIKIKRVVK